MHIAENIFGYLGALCWSIQLVPQVWKSWREKSTEGLSHYLVFMWGVAGSFLGIYVITQNLNIPLILQPQLLSTLSLVSWGQCQYYGNKRSKLASVILTSLVAAVLGGFEAGMIFAIKSDYHGGLGNRRPLEFFGISSSVIISLALFPQYYEIWKHGEVIGISVTFMTVDLLGGVFSDLSLVFKKDPDVIATVTYSLVVVLDAVVIICALILNPRADRRRKMDAQIGDTPMAASQSEQPLPETNG